MRLSYASTTVLLLALGAAIVAACSAGGGGGGSTAGGGTGGNGGGGIVSNGGNGGGSLIPTGTILTPECTKDCTDFPSAPIVEGVTAAQQSALDQPASGAGPCVMEPATGTLFPANWTRPRFNFTAGAVSKITLTAAREKNPLVVYTNAVPWVMPKDIWLALSKNVLDEDITYSIKTGNGTGAPTETTGTFRIAPVAVGGSMVYWGATTSAAGPETNKLYGFGVGDDGVITALVPGEIGGVALTSNANPRTKDTTTPGQSTCVGCHSSTPDGKAVATMDDWEWNIRVSSIEPGKTGQAPEFLSPAGAAMASMTWLGAPTFSAGNWATGARRMVTTWSIRTFDNYQEGRTHAGTVESNTPTELVWMNLASTVEVPSDLRTEVAVAPAGSAGATGGGPVIYNNQNQALEKALVAMKGTEWDVIERTGDPGSPVLPDWDHSGGKIVYTSTDMPQDGRIGQATVVDLYTLPSSGGAATPLDGASSADAFEYYPDYSPDDALVAFNRVPKFTTSGGREDSYMHVYYRPDSDIYVIPAAGGEAVRLKSNDAACPSEGATGNLYNSWAKWAPSYASGNGKTYYFLIFSTSRNSPYVLPRGSTHPQGSPASQLYMATVVRNTDGSIESFPAIYLWNQRSLVDADGNVTELKTNNVTPAWDEFKIPPVPPIIVR
jgi:hypothetical protein